MTELRAENANAPGDRAAPASSEPSEEAGLRDAQAIAERIAADEQAAARARERYASEPMAPIEPDPAIVRLLEPGEQVFSIRHGALLNPPRSDERVSLSGYGGTLYLTSARLIHVGQITVTIDLRDIEEVVLAGEQLLLTLAAGEAVNLTVERPRLLRVEISAVRQSADRE